MITSQTKATLADYARLPEGAPVQLIGGALIDMPSPSLRHQRVIGKLHLSLAQAAQSTGGTVLLAPMDVYFDEENVFQPDLLFVSEARAEILSPEGVRGAPDLIIEVLSPSTGYYDLKDKRLVYERYGVREYFAVDPADGLAMGYVLDGKRFRERTPTQRKLVSEVLGATLTF